MSTVKSHHCSTRHGRVLFGMFLMAAGTLMLVERLQLAEVRLTSHLWPLFPIALGLVRLIDPPVRPDGRVRSRRSAIWLLLLGGWGFVNEFQLYGLRYDNSWPLLFVIAGLNMVWKSVERPPAVTSDQGHTS